MFAGRNMQFSQISDPLADLTFALRLQTSKGNGVPLGLYTDISGTTPVTFDGDLIACWADKLSGSGLSMIQGDWTKRPVYRQALGVELDNVRDMLTLTRSRTTAYTIVARIKATAVVNETRYFYVNWTAAGVQGGVYAALNEYIAWGLGSRGPVLNEWITVTVIRSDATNVILRFDGIQIASLNAGQVADDLQARLTCGTFASFFIFDSVLSAPHLARVEAYAGSL